jgi:hypothetical protein
MIVADYVLRDNGRPSIPSVHIAQLSTLSKIIEIEISHKFIPSGSQLQNSGADPS